MSIFSRKSKPAAPAITLAGLEQKLAELTNHNPLAAVPALQDERKRALLANDYARVDAIDGELRRAQLDSERKELETEQLHRELERAQADELEAKRNETRAAAEAKSQEMPEALAELEKAFDLVREKLAVVEGINDSVASANALLPEGSKLPNPEAHWRGALPADKREEVGRRRLGSRWFYRDTGAPVDPGKAEFVEGSDRKIVGNIETSDGVRGRIKILDRDVGAYRNVEVVKKDIVEVAYLEARGGFTPVPLSAEVYLPAVMPTGGADPRRERQRITQIIHQAIVPAPKAADEQAA
jgi:hypothetical protein